MRRARPWCGVANAPVDGFGVLVIGAGHPGRAAARLPVVSAPGVMPRLALTGNGEGTPQFLAVIRIVGDDVAAHTELAAGAADDHFAIDHERHQREILALL